MSGNESGREHDSEERAAGRDPLAWAREVTADGADPQDRVGIPLTLDASQLPASRLARLESPAELYPLMRPVPNSRPWTAAEEEWFRSFSIVAPRGGMTTVTDHDAQGSATAWSHGPEAAGR